MCVYVCKNIIVLQFEPSLTGVWPVAPQPDCELHPIMLPLVPYYWVAPAEAFHSSLPPSPTSCEQPPTNRQRQSSSISWSACVVFDFFSLRTSGWLLTVRQWAFFFFTGSFIFKRTSKRQLGATRIYTHQNHQSTGFYVYSLYYYTVLTDWLVHRIN